MLFEIYITILVFIIVVVLPTLYTHYENSDPTSGMTPVQKERYKALKTCYFCKKTFRKKLNSEEITPQMVRPVCDKCYRAVYEKMVRCCVCNRMFRLYQTIEWERDRMFLPDDDGTMRIVQQKGVIVSLHICNTCKQIDFEYVVLQFLEHLTPRQQEVMYMILLEKLTKDDIAVLVSTINQEMK